MEWSQTYAPFFGGNIEEATITGCSSAGEATWWLLTMETAWPYFNRASVMGMGLNTVYDSNQAVINYQSVLKALQCTTVECARAMPADDVAMAAQHTAFTGKVQNSLP